MYEAMFGGKIPYTSGYFASISWGDGTASQASYFCIVDSPPLPPYMISCFINGTHTYSAAMTGISLQVIFLGHQISESCSSGLFDVEPAPSDVLSHPTLLLAAAITGVPVTGVIATFTDSNTLTPASEFSASINWGDGTQSGGVVSGSGGIFNVSAPPGGHSYATLDPLMFVSVTLTQIPPGTASSTASGTVIVTGPSPPPTTTPPPTMNFQGLWWVPGGAESGWGLNIAHQNDVIYATWFTYDVNGKAWWLSMTANKTGEGVYSGMIYQYTGAPFSAYVPPAMAAPVGSGILTFTSASSGTFAYTVSGVTQDKSIVPEAFGPLPTCVWGAQPDLTKATNVTDLWWALSGSEPGWGVNLTEQGTTIFATWFTYDNNGNPLWLSVTAVQTAPNTFTGSLDRTRGPAFGAPWTGVTHSPSGTATFTFTDGNNGTFAYNVDLGDGVNRASQSKAITREVFGTLGTVCQ
jgi:hypothetical protein